MAVINYRASEQEEPKKVASSLPPGDYIAIITESDMVENSKRNGHYLKLTLEIVDGDFSGRKLFDNINLDNPSADAVRIARQTMKQICVATGKGNDDITDSEELHNIPLGIRVKMEERRDKPGEFGHKVSFYFAPKNAPEVKKNVTTPAAEPTKKRLWDK